MDEGGGLENRYMGDCIVGSNPTPSATTSFILALKTLSFVDFMREPDTTKILIDYHRLSCRLIQSQL